MLNCCPERLKGKKNKWWVFTAGPIQGAPNWQHALPNNENIIWQSPRRKSYDKFDYDEQVKWEHDMMAASDIILFWIPKESEHIEGRQYAQTTRTEIGEYFAQGKKIFIGIEEAEFPGRKYFESKAKEYGLEIKSSLNELLKDIAKFINEENNNAKLCFTSDTHFSQERAFELSKRPFRDINDMDWTMIRNWNKVVHPNDTVLHLGDFGELWPLEFLNGTIDLIAGNYEEKDIKKNPKLEKKIKESFNDFCDSTECGVLELENPDGDENEYVYCCAHEPIKTQKLVKETRKRNKKNGLKNKVYGLFGHIHGRQKIKEFGIDVGVDGNNYQPLTEDDVIFYLNAIDKGFYDEEVFS